jgi:hypothetical protein
MHNNSRHDLPLPAGARTVHDWEPEGGTWSRYFTGDTRKIERAGSEPARIYVGGSQYLDGCVERSIVVAGLDKDIGFTVGQARRVAAEILSAADDADRWTAGGHVTNYPDER